jgi:hypothetical protein
VPPTLPTSPPLDTAPRLPEQEPGGQELRIGAGRSGIVFLSRDAEGTPIARKVFESSTLTRLVQYALLGAANPYAWNEDLVRAALLRRRILGALCQVWFPGRLTVAAAHSHGWNEEYRAFELLCAFSPGRPPRLHHPLDRSGRAEVQELREEIMRPLAGHLAEAGFDGQLWQAGLGNPVAFANFLLETSDSGERVWTWIDVESGVPALFPLDPRVLFRTYLPMSWKHRGPLFDHVDVDRLEAWLHANRAFIDARLGAGTTHQLESEASALRVSADAWSSMSRRKRAIQSQVAKGKITQAQAERYANQPVRWCLHEARRAVRGTFVRATGFTKRNWALMRRLRLGRLPRAVTRFGTSQVYRERVAREFVLKRIDRWEQRRRLAPEAARALRERAQRETSSAWVSDFAVHVAIKPIVKGTEWILFPLLMAAGLLEPTTVPIVILAGGSVSRTIYTSGRLIQDAFRGRELPWTALWVGILPVIGNLAFPLQIVRSGRDSDDPLARFVLYDSMSVLGRRMPIWGGPDTLTEHVFNHLPDRVLHGPPPPST